MKKFWQKYKLVIAVFLIWRVSLFIIGLFGFSLLTFKASFPFIDEELLSSGFPQSVWHWANFDGVHYLVIASQGYRGLIGNEQVFFPLFPILVKAVQLITGNYVLAGLLVSNFAALIAGVLLFKLSAKYFDQNVAVWTILFFYLFPTSFFFGSLYTESVFLVLVLTTFLVSGLKSVLPAIAAGTARLVGGFVLPTGFVGVGAYCLYLWVEFGNPLYFLFAQGGFKNERANSLTTLITPIQTAVRYLKIFVTANPAHYDFWIAAIEFTAFFFGVGILFYLTFRLRNKIPFSWSIFSWSALILPSLSGTFSSMPRYLLVIFPTFIALGIIRRRLLKIVILTLFAILQMILTVLFTRGYWVA